MSFTAFCAALDRSGVTRPGLLTAPADPGWDEARRAFNLVLDQRPAVVAHPADVAEVQGVVRAAREAGLRVAPQRTGHGATPLGALDDVVLLRTDALDEVSIDPETRIARIGAGALWREVAGAAEPHGLWPLSGSSPTVGAAGFLLGGGLPLLGREFGVGANRVRAVELVTAAGEIVRADTTHEAELFWAVRGAGANVGVVTAVEVELLPLTGVHAGCLFFPMERAPEVLPAWLELVRDAPDRFTAIGRLLRVPDMPGVPPPLAGRAFVVVEVIATGDEDVVARLEPLRALGPEIDMVQSAPAAVLGRVHMDPEDPVPAATDHISTGALPPDAVDALIAAAGAESGSSLVSVELRPLGGALAVAPADGGAVASLPGDFALFAVGVAAGPGAEAVVADLAAVRAALEPWAVGRVPTFTDTPMAADDVFGAETAARLRAARERWDPDALLVANHPV